jgi:diguanylate cyclase (GGDEF)-like protein
LLWVDTHLRISLAGGSPYVILVLLGLLSQSRGAVLGLAAVASILTVVGHLITPSVVDPRYSMINRGLALSTIWFIAVLALIHLNAQLVARARLEWMATYDALTGVYNRRFVLEQLQRLVKMARRYDQPFGVVLLDVDHFKRVNDRRGHAAGDEVLQTVCAVTRRCIRDVDVLGRYGGEEFLVLLPNADREEAVAVAERIRGAVRAARAPVAGDPLRVTVSLGVSVPAPGVEDAASLIAAADAALYAAKRGGRNRVCAAPAHRPSLHAEAAST